MDCSSCSRICF